jgi:pilus assembly protein CpaE
MTSVPRTMHKDILLISPDPESFARLAQVAAAAGRTLSIERDLDGLLSKADQSSPRLVLLDVGEGAMLDDPRIAAFRQRLGSVPLIALSAELGPERVRQLLRLQANDWLQRPFSDGEFITSLRQASGDRGTASQVTLFLPANGGAGATSMALMAAHALARSGGGTTCIVDLDFQHASCGVYLNLQNELDLGSIVAAPERLDDELLELLKRDKAPGIALFSFERPDLYYAAAGRDFVLRLLDLVSSKYANVIVDLPSIETPWFSDVVRSSDSAVVVFEANVPSMRQARRAVNRLKELSRTVHIQVVANKTAFAPFGNMISKKDITKMLGDVPVSYVRSDGETMKDALNRALLPQEVAGRSSFVREAEKTLLPLVSRT